MLGQSAARRQYDFFTGEVACVYIIRCTINNSVYIGQTRFDLTRAAEHFTALRTNNHHNYKLQNDYNLFGDEAFYFKRVKSFVKNKEKRLWIESDYIIRAKERELKRYGIKIYNLDIPKRETIGFEFKQDRE